jgi:hypothetical protein
VPDSNAERLFRRICSQVFLVQPGQQDDRCIHIHVWSAASQQWRSAAISQICALHANPLGFKLVARMHHAHELVVRDLAAAQWRPLTADAVSPAHDAAVTTPHNAAAPPRSATARSPEGPQRASLRCMEQRRTAMAAAHRSPLCQSLWALEHAACAAAAHCARRSYATAAASAGAAFRTPSVTCRGRCGGQLASSR